MAKKIRFPLEMDNGIQVRSIEELKENFSLERVIEYYHNGKLVVWLRDRYCNHEADRIEALDKKDAEFNKKLCEIFGIDFKRVNRLSKLSEFTDGNKYYDVIDSVAFEQDDIYDILDEGKDVIYLCGDKFTIPVNKEGITYIGINKPKVIFNYEDVKKTDENNIVLKDVVKTIVFNNINFDEGEDVKRIDDIKGNGVNKGKIYFNID